ncbi:hypothetical protein MSG28_013462 [Choristoneura fumiferana]|uniref:Uncharacterized protein n=1 Tax=Choristoneura fumiferana TaxID=7141 RepID=A0ACC0KT47_CHOFU|nr:hypothetical protein MSG28_013462 [Choristoneura fumiferana]
MERTCLLVCLCVGVHLVYGQVASLCRPNERFLSCGGCQKTCLDPAPACVAVCRIGCYCQLDEVRNSTGHCVPLSECPSGNSAYKLDTSEPRQECPPTEEYRFCEPCNRTCEDPNPVCPAQCARGCFCKDDLLRDKDGSCVEYGKCSKFAKNESSAYKLDTSEPRQECPPTEEYRFCEPCNRTCEDPNPVCPAQCARGCFCKDDLLRDKDGSCVEYGKCSKFAKNESYDLRAPPGLKDCEPCEKTCSNPNPVCPAQCNKGCFCEDGLLKAPSGKCVKLEDCPKDCAPDEEFLSCGWCEPSCWEPAPACPRVCTRGCLCQKCLNPNEEFVCRYGCEARCGGGGGCIGRPRRCQLGCHCRLGLLRDPATGHCVTPAQCKEKDMKRVVFTKDTDTLARIKQIIGDSNVKVEVVES